MPAGDAFATTLASHLGKGDHTIGIALHVAGDLLVLLCIWRFTGAPRPAAG